MTEAKRPKPPAQLRITLKQQLEYHYSDDYSSHTTTVGNPLGFAIPYKPTIAAYAKQKRTQDDWAYTDSSMQGHFERDGKYWFSKSSWQPKNGMTREEAHNFTGSSGFELITTEEIVPEQYQPIIIDNIPQEGFRIQHVVARHRGNKLWRILDPRGFELEIASGTFEELVMSGVVDRGLIIGPCIWQSGKMLVRV
jgi:hypothetical protein